MKKERAWPSNSGANMLFLVRETRILIEAKALDRVDMTWGQGPLFIFQDFQTWLRLPNMIRMYRGCWLQTTQGEQEPVLWLRDLRNLHMGLLEVGEIEDVPLEDKSGQFHSLPPFGICRSHLWAQWPTRPIRRVEAITTVVTWATDDLSRVVTIRCRT